MQFLKDFFTHDKTVIGLCGLKKRTQYVCISVPQNYKTTYIPKNKNNYLYMIIITSNSKHTAFCIKDSPIYMINSSGKWVEI